MRKLTLLTLFCALATGAMAGDGWNEAMTVFKAGDKDGKNGYRIPAITSTGNGSLIGVADYRYKNKDWNTDMGVTGANKMPYLVVKTSNDGGNTWIESEIEMPLVVNPDTGKEEIGLTDSAVVHNQETGSTFLFGFTNIRHIAVSPDKEGATPNETDINDTESKFYVASSNDGGKTWSEFKNIKEDILDELEKQGINRGKYENILQGPGGGLTYNGTVYVPIQMFNEGNKWGGDFTSTSGFIYSEDNGKSWKVATLEGVLPQGDKPSNTVSTSESNLFYHNGKICIAAKVENGGGNPEYEGKRVAFTYENGKWERLEENFLPDDMAKCETSTLSLSEQVYLVGYSAAVKNPDGGETRTDTFITTNTGRKIKVLEGQTYGYTSMTQDQDNLYILFETNQGVADINMRRYDIASKEYANLNAQILDRGQSLLDVQGKLSSDQYVGGTYTNESESGAEAVVELNNFKIGAFHRNTKDNSDDVYRTIPYNLKETTLVLSQDNAFMQGDNIFAGYQAGKIEYSNKSTNDLTSFVMGYTFNKELENDKTYIFALNGVYSNNKVERNKAEGVGRTAEFDSYSISMKNALSKNISFTDSANLKLTAGLNTTVFGHDEFEEDGGIQTVDGGKWNNAKVDKSQNVSNEIFAKATLDQRVKLTDKSSVRLALNLGWEKELMNVDEWRDEFTVLDVEKEFSTPVKKHEGGLGKAEVSATFDLAEKVELGVGYSMDTDGESIATGKVTYKL